MAIAWTIKLSLPKLVSVSFKPGKTQAASPPEIYNGVGGFNVLEFRVWGFGMFAEEVVDFLLSPSGNHLREAGSASVIQGDGVCFGAFKLVSRTVICLGRSVH